MREIVIKQFKPKKRIQTIAVSDLHLKDTVKSILNTSEYLNCKPGYLFTSKLDSEIITQLNHKDIKVIKIAPIKNHIDYNYFIIYELHKYLIEDFCLIVQWDGSVMCNWMWSNEFLNYDYIGAPFLQRKNDRLYCRDKTGIFRSVGNGGFSLRSKRILEAPTKLDLVDEPEFTNAHEDGFFSVLHRQKLEEHGYKWAPVKIARDFSQEKARNILDLIRPSFGYHGKIFKKITILWKPINYLVNKLIDN